MKLPNAERAVVDPVKVRDYLLAVARDGEAEPGETSVFGQKYVVRGIVRGPAGRAAEVVTAWIVLRGEDVPRLVLPTQRGPATTKMPTESPCRELDTVVLLRDVPEAGLRAGDLGAVVGVYGAEALEVEFVTNSGRTQALRTLAVVDVRPLAGDDLPAVRRAGAVPGAA